MVDINDENKVWTEDPTTSLLVQVEKQNGIRVYSIMTYTGRDLATLQPEAKFWPAPSLIRLQGTILGREPFTFYLDSPRKVLKDGIEYDLKVLPDFTMEEQFDALLYIGPTSSITFSKLPASLCQDPAWLKMRLGRTKYASPGMSKPIEGMIKTTCEEILKKNAK